MLESPAMQASRTQVQAPLRSLDQRMDALRRANEIRVRRAQLKKDLKAGNVQIEEILSTPAAVRRDREGRRHPHGRPEVRAREGGTVPEPVPDQPIQDRGRPLRAAAHGAGGPAAPLTRGATLQLAAGGRLIVVTGPSGAGKGTLIRKLVGRRPDLELAGLGDDAAAARGRGGRARVHVPHRRRSSSGASRPASSSSTSSTSPATGTGR